MSKQEISGPSITLELHQEMHIEDRRHSAVRCYACGSPQVRAVCHHCGKFLCAKHIARPHFYEEPSREFKDMVRPSQWRKSAHCEEDSHFVFAYLRGVFIPALIGSILVACPFLTVLANRLQFAWRFFREPVPHSVWMSWLIVAWHQGERRLILNLVFDLFGPALILFALAVATVGTTIIGYWLYVRKGIPNLENHPKHPPMGDIPLPPSRYSVEATEKLHVQMSVSPVQPKHVDIQSATGRVNIQAELDQQVQASLRTYRERAKKYGWKPQRAVGWNLGSMALDIPRNVKWLPQLSPQGRTNNLLTLGRSHREIPEVIGEGQHRWVKLVEHDYSLEREALYFGQADKRRAILRVIPVLQPMSAARTVIFLFSLPESLSDANWALRRLTLHLPPEAFAEGEVGFPVIGTNGVPDSSNWQVKWPRWRLSGKMKASDYPSVTFSGPVSRLHSPLRLEFELEGDRLVSKLNVADHIWLPTGAAVEPQAILGQYKTIICGVLDVDPLFFSYQSEYAVSKTLRLQLAVTPDLLHDLLERLSEGNPDVTVHTVSQNTPLVTVQEGYNLVGWDLFGRYYAQIYPIDVHLCLSSRFPMAREKQGDKGPDTTASLTCRALVNSQTEYVQEQAEWLADKLVGIVREVANGKIIE